MHYSRFIGRVLAVPSMYLAHTWYIYRIYDRREHKEIKVEFWPNRIPARGVGHSYIIKSSSAELFEYEKDYLIKMSREYAKYS